MTAKDRSLLPSEPETGSPMSRIGTVRKPDARFVAQLLAARAQLAAQRAKRKAAPEEGAAAYRGSFSVTEAARRRLDRAL